MNTNLCHRVTENTEIFFTFFLCDLCGSVAIFFVNHLLISIERKVSQTFVFLLLIFCCLTLNASDINQLIEDGYIVIDIENEQEYEDFLVYFIDNQILWKNAKTSQFEQLPINDFLKSSLMIFHKKNIKITDWKSFQNISGFSDLEMETFNLFITFEQKKYISGKIYNFNSLKGEENLSINKNLIRMKIDTPSDWNIGGIIERDQDEIHIVDHINFSLQSPLMFGRLKLIFGSFPFKWGTGLFFNTNPMNMISNAGIGSFYNADAKFRAYSGSDENNHLFGTTVSYQSKFAELFTFYSKNKMDCNIDNGVVTSADYSGYHVSENDLKNHNKLRNITSGLGTRFQIRQLQTGIMIYNSSFNYQLQDFDNQKSLIGSSVFYNYQYSNIYSKGEIAISGNQKYAITHALLYRSKNIQTGFNFRYIQDNFQSFAGSTLRHFSGNLENEKGFYYYFGIRINKYTKFTIFNDFYSRIISVNDGEDIKLGTYTGLYLKHNLKTKSYLELKIARKNNLEILKNNYTVKFKYRLFNNIMLTNQYYYTKIVDSKSQSQGFSSYLSSGIKEHSFSFGTTHFFSNSSECNLYIYEPGIPLRYNMVTLSETGRNIFVNYLCQINQQTKIFLSAKQSSKSGIDKYFLQIQLLVAL